MGELVDLDRYRPRRVPAPDAVDIDDSPLAPERMAQLQPDPEAFGWLVVEEDDAGLPTRWFHPRWVAQIGFVPQAPEWVFLDHDTRIRAWRSLGVGDLAVKLDAAWSSGTGAVPEPDVVLNWDGTPATDAAD